MLDLIKSINKTLAIVTPTVATYCKDTRISTDVRWAAALEAPWAFIHDGSTLDTLEVLGVESEISWYDDFDLDKDSSLDIMCDDFIADMLEIFPAVESSEIKESILQSGIKSFTNSW